METTKLDDLKKIQEGEVVELPFFDDDTPFNARLKRPSLLTLCKTGVIPNSLLAAAQKIFEGEKKGNVKDYGEVLHTVAYVALQEPGYEDVKDILTDEQLTAIFNYTQFGVAALMPFRKLREKYLESKKAGSSSKGK